MKHIGIYIVSGLLVLALTVSGISAYAASSAEHDKPTVWYKDIATTYSTRGTDNAFNYTELNAQIPDIEPCDRNEVLALSKGQVMSMSTEELLVTCLDYPLFGDFALFDNSVMGFERVSDRYNGLQALMNREDVGDVLCDFYAQINLDKVLSTDEFSHLRFEYLTLLFADDKVVQKISPENRKAIIKQCVQNCTDMYSKYKGQLNYIQTARLAGKIMCLENTQFAELVKSSEVIQDFLNTGIVGNYSDEEWKQVVKYVMEYV